MLTLIDRLIIKTFFGYFFAGLVVFVTLFLVADFTGMMTQHDVSGSILLRYYGYFIPEVVFQMFPVACLLATLFTLSGMDKANELMALFSMGWSLARVSAPILVVISLLSVFMFWAGDQILPHFSQKKSYIFFVEIRKRPGLFSTVKTDRIWYRSDNILFNIQTLVPNETRAQGMTLYYFNSDWDLVQLVRAQSVKMNSNQWTLKDGAVTLFAEESSFPITKKFDQKIITMNEEIGDLQQTSRSTDGLNLSELSRFIARNKAAGLETLTYEMDYHGKFGFALAGFVMSLMGIPFSVGRTRSGGNVLNIGICLGFSFLYWLIYNSALTMGRHGWVSPVVAAWGPNLIMAAAAVFFLLRLKK